MLPGGLVVTARKPCPQLVAAMPVLPGYRMLYDAASDAGNSQISLLACAALSGASMWCGCQESAAVEKWNAQ